ncbi:MAG: helix-turn-helix domain-containing protein [Labilithrix sp.]|nr:helix-turn-helix domain-containing protein [Labilithrix sp.]
MDVESCAGCGDVYVPASLMIAFERAVAGELARRGPVSDETFRWIRKAAGIERGELAQILGVTPETIAGWESERRPIDRAAWQLVAAVVLDGIEGPRAVRTRLKVPHRNPSASVGAPIGAEVALELPPGGMIARVLSLLAGPIEFTDADIADALDLDLAALRAQLRELAALGLIGATTATTPNEAERWRPSTRDAAALLQRAAEAGVDLDAPIARASRKDGREAAAQARTPSSTWRATPT